MSARLISRQTVLLVARREFTAQVRSRSFVIGLVITVVLIGGVALLGGSAPSTRPRVAPRWATTTSTRCSPAHPATTGCSAGVTGLLTVPGAAVGMFVMVIVWYLLGFFLFASLYAGIGSTVSRQEELGSVIAPMVFLIIIPFVLTVNLLPNDPRNELAAVLSFVPFFAQTVMPARYALGVAPLWEVGVSALITLAALAVVVRPAGRVYRNSILRTGSRVSLKEALRG
jgi:ABC-type Na+ efflux pump permease subunit